jgi:hypothetical protein
MVVLVYFQLRWANTAPLRGIPYEYDVLRDGYPSRSARGCSAKAHRWLLQDIT